MTEDQAKKIAEAVLAAAGDECAACFAASSSQPTRVIERVRELVQGGAKTFDELAKKPAEAEAAKGGPSS